MSILLLFAASSSSPLMRLREQQSLIYRSRPKLTRRKGMAQCLVRRMQMEKRMHARDHSVSCFFFFGMTPR